jgi:hypothetical protein
MLGPCRRRRYRRYPMVQSVERGFAAFAAELPVRAMGDFGRGGRDDEATGVRGPGRRGRGYYWVESKILGQAEEEEGPLSTGPKCWVESHSPAMLARRPSH